MQWIEAGKIVNTHGARGEVKIEPWCDSPEFLLGFDSLLIDSKIYKVSSARVHKGMALAKLEGVDDISAANAFRGKVVSIDREGVELPEGRYFVRDLVGLEVVDTEGRRVGTLYEVLPMPAQDVYVVRGDMGEHYIPSAPEFIKDIDIEAGRITVELIEGM